MPVIYSSFFLNKKMYNCLFITTVICIVGNFFDHEGAIEGVFVSYNGFLYVIEPPKPGSAHPMHSKPITDTRVAEQSRCLFCKAQRQLLFTCTGERGGLRLVVLQSKAGGEEGCDQFSCTSLAGPQCPWPSLDRSVMGGWRVLLKML